MICENYDKLSHAQKVIFIGQLTHAAQSDNDVFDLANHLITLAVAKGLFNGVEIIPERPDEEKDQ